MRQPNLLSSIVIIGLLVLVASWAPGQAADPLVSGQLEIQGSRLSLHPDDISQVADVGERRLVRTCYGGAAGECVQLDTSDPRIAGLAVLADLSGPELPEPLPLQTVPGGAFHLPGFQQEGEYLLQNIRLVSTLTDQVLGPAEPSVAVISVHQILLASATVEALSLEELQARGITLTEENFQAFNFAVGFAFGTETVYIDFPVLYEGNGSVSPLSEPRVTLEDPDSPVASTVARWKVPHIVPFKLEVPPESYVDVGEEDDEVLDLPLFGAIVIPGNVSFLNQFFEARLIVANGAPAGSDVELANLTGALRLPDGNVLRLAETDPPVVVGQPVPLVAAGGGSVLDPGNQATAAWTVEGLVAGTHTLSMDIAGEIVRPNEDPLPVTSRAQAAVEVVDARFHLTFTHPDVVREGEGYTLYVTVTNMSRAAQNRITVNLEGERIVGATPVDAAELTQEIETLEPGEAQTLEMRFVAGLDGQVVASTFSADSATGTGSIQLTTGVGELGIPLSPASLVMPRFSERLAAPYNGIADDELLRANVRLLGLAYSLAVAPAGMTPQGLPAVITSDVERRAVDLAEAGQRTFLHEELLDSLEVLALDQLGNRHQLAEFDELRRGLEKGAAAATELARMIRDEQQSYGTTGLDAAELVDHFAETTSYAEPYLAAALIPDGAGEWPVLEVRSVADGVTGLLTRPSDADDTNRTLPWGEMYSILRDPAGTDTASLALVGHVEEGQVYHVQLFNQSAAAASGRLILIVPDDQGGFRKLDYGTVTVQPGDLVAVDVATNLGAGADDFRFYYPATGLWVAGAPTASLTQVQLPPFELIGAVQDFRMDANGGNRYGNGVSYLFNRPPDQVSGADPANYVITSVFSGYDTTGAVVDPPRVNVNQAAAAFIQDSGRVVNVRYQRPVSALIDVNDDPVVQHTQTTLDVSDGTEYVQLPPGFAPEIDIEKRVELGETVGRVGGLIEGRVVRGTGDAVEGAVVKLIRHREVDSATGYKLVLDVVGEATTGSDGTFYFDFVEDPHWDRMVRKGFTLRASIPASADEPAQVQEIGSLIRDANQNRLGYLNIALLGRGTVTGDLLYLDGAAVAGGTVTATSTLFNESKTVDVLADGSFELVGVPVGPLTLTGRDPEGRVVYETIALSGPGDTYEITLYLFRDEPPPGLGTVTGTVFLLGADGVSTEPLAGADVAVYSGGNLLSQVKTNDLGRFRFEQVPEGQVTLQAADFRFSRTPVLMDLILARHETADIDLVLFEADTRSVCGEVLFHDPLLNQDLPVADAVAFISGPGVFAYTDANGQYCIEGVPVQGPYERQYSVQAIDYGRSLQGSALLDKITDASLDPVSAPAIVLAEMRGGVQGVVLDPLGQPVSGVGVVLRAKVNNATVVVGESSTLTGGAFSFTNVPLSDQVEVVAHYQDGLQDGYLGYLGSAQTRVSYGGHVPFVTVPMRGAGIVQVNVTSAGNTIDDAQVYYKPTYFSDIEKKIRIRGSYIEEQYTGGTLSLQVPVGPMKIAAYSPFNGFKEVDATIDYAGQSVTVNIELESTSTVTGTVVDVDGVTPVPGIQVTLETRSLLPETLTTDAQGGFRFELVPLGRLSVTAAGLVGGVERVGRADGLIADTTIPLDLTVQMKAQGSVTGCVTYEDGSAATGAVIYLQEGSYPFRRLPMAGAYPTDASGCYEVSHVYAGPVTVVANDGGIWTQAGRAGGTLQLDWEVLTLGDIVLTEASRGTIEVTIRDPENGAPVPDCQVKMNTGEVTVADTEGTAYFEALPLGTYQVYAFHAPTGRAGLLQNLQLTSAGQTLVQDLYLNSVGEVNGTLFDEGVPRPGGTVRLQGMTAAGSLTALATSSYEDVRLGEFRFIGIPEGDFELLATVPDSPRRAQAQAHPTKLTPVVSVAMHLESMADVCVDLSEHLSTGDAPVDATQGQFSLAFDQGSGYSFNLVYPEAGTPNRFRFPGVLLERPAELTVQEITGEQRSAFSSFNPDLVDCGTGAYSVLLDAKGIVEVWVRDGGDNPVAGADLVLQTAGGRLTGVTDSTGYAVFYAVSAGAVTATATTSLSGGQASDLIEFDDDAVELNIQLTPTFSVQGTVYQPLPGDRDTGERIPQAGAIVEIGYPGGSQLVATDDAGQYTFDGITAGAVTVTATLDAALASLGLNVSGTQGELVTLPYLVLDGSPPRIESIQPEPGMTGVSRTAAVEIIFSEQIAAPPAGDNPQPRYTLESTTGALASGQWTNTVSGFRTVVRFVPSAPYDNQTWYRLTLTGGNNGIKDLAGRKLAENNISFNFKTSDTEGPEVISVEPDLARPVDPAQGSLIRFNFNEAVGLPGSGTPVSYLMEGDSGWAECPLTAGTDYYLTRSGYTLTLVVPEQVCAVDGDTLQRAIQLRGITQADNAANVMADRDWFFRIYDDNPPAIGDLPFPLQAPDGVLSQGTTYTLAPVFDPASLDEYDATTNPGGDLDFVEYFTADPTAPGFNDPPLFTSLSHPFGYSFVAVYTGTDGTPSSFNLWARATDTSTNTSNVVDIQMSVQPNRPPELASVTVEAVAPVPGTFNPGSVVRATLNGVNDLDSGQLTATVSLWDQISGKVDGPVSRLLEQAAGDWVAPEFDLVIPISLPAGSNLYVQAVLTDSRGATVTVLSDLFEVAADAIAPEVTSLVARRAGDGQAAAQFINGESLYFEVRASDAETEVTGVELGFDQEVFGSSVGLGMAATRVAGSTDLYRTGQVTVDISTNTPLQVTATALDRGDNPGTRSTTLDLQLAPDEAAPTAQWLTPWEGAAWPAEYSATAPEGTPMLVRAYIQDLDRDAGDELIPGEINHVSFRGPDGVDVAGTQVAGSPDQGLFEAVLTIANQVAPGTELDFEVTVTDFGGNSTTVPVRMQAQTPGAVYTGLESSILADQSLPESGPVFVLGGLDLSIYPLASGEPRHVEALYLYSAADASRITAPDPNTYSSLDAYLPLLLQVDSVLGIGAGAAIDVSGCGLMGGDTDNEPVVLDGQTPATERAGGSHGGSGWFGGSGLSGLPGNVFGNVREPQLPGGGGHSPIANRGGDGGGVIRIDASTAVVHAAGDIRADGNPGASANGGSGAGAGGSILLLAHRLEGDGVVSASGGNAALTTTGGGGGGRVAVYYRESASDPAARCQARGGSNTADALGAAGTVYLEQADEATGEWTGIGALHLDTGGYVAGGQVIAAATALPALVQATVASADSATGTVVLDAPSRIGDITGESVLFDGGTLGTYPVLGQEPIDDTQVRLTLDTGGADLSALVGAGAHSRARFASLRLAGVARMAAGDDLEIGAAGTTPVLNDRAALLVEDDARAMLRGEGLLLEITEVVPADGSDVRVGSTVELTWQASDPLGLLRSVRSWNYESDLVSTFSAIPVAAGPGTVELQIPATATAPTPADNPAVTLTLTSLDGDTTEQTVSWNLLPNASPLVTMTLTETSVLAGRTTTVNVAAEDAEGLASIELLASGPVVEESQSVTPGDNPVVAGFTLTTVEGSAGGTVTLFARVTDSSGEVVSTETQTITVVPDTTSPVVTLSMQAPAEGDAYKSGETVPISVSATDDIRVTGISLTGGGIDASASVSPLEHDWLVPLVSAETSVTLTATALDPSGNPGVDETTVTVRPAYNPGDPNVAFDCPAADAILPAGYANLVLAVTATDDDGTIAKVEFFAGDATTPFDTKTAPADTDTFSTQSIPTTLPATPGPATFRAKVWDNGNNTREEVLTVTVVDAVPYDGLADHSSDVVYIDSNLTLDGTQTFAGLMILRGATVTHTPSAAGTYGNMLHLDVNGPMHLECGAAIDVSGMGYPGDGTYPGEDPPQYLSGGSHIGSGGSYVKNGITYPAGSTFGSVYRPMESGGGGYTGRRGGGAVQIEADSLVCGGTIAANGATTGGSARGGAGGSIWITVTGRVSGPGSIQANGTTINDAGGGGGAIAIEYGSVEGAILDNVHAVAGTGTSYYYSGGAGTVYLFERGVSTHGDLRLDNNNTWKHSLTILPSLGSGTVASTGGAGTFSIGAGQTVQPFFVGHWVEITDPGTGIEKGTWRIEAISGSDITLAAGDTPPDVAAGDLWRGVYLFDSVSITRFAELKSDDPIRMQQLAIDSGGRIAEGVAFVAENVVLGIPGTFDPASDPNEAAKDVVISSPIVATQSVVVKQKVTADSIEAFDLTIERFAVLSHPATSSSFPVESLHLQVDNLLRIDAGASVDVTGKGYPGNVTYEGEDPPQQYAAGSHVGSGGNYGTSLAGTTFGSVYRPHESGGGGEHASGGMPGGGIVRIEAGSFECNGTVAASGASDGGDRGGAGGSIWITVDGALSGSGSIAADGSKATRSSGGGGSIAVEYGSAEESVLDHLSALGGDGTYNKGGAGTIFLFEDGSSQYGDLIIDNNGRAGSHTTRLPALGGGTLGNVQGASFDSGLGAPIPDYFVGHWVEVRDSLEAFKGVWRIAEVGGSTITLEPNYDGEVIPIVANDRWQGIYLFDSVAVVDRSRITSDDPIRVSDAVVNGGAAILGTSLFEADSVILGFPGVFDPGSNPNETAVEIVIDAPLAAAQSVVVKQQVSAKEIEAGNMTIEEFGFLTHPASQTDPEMLHLKVANQLTITTGGWINVSGKGYGPGTTYIGEIPAGVSAGGSHIGLGGNEPAGATYGSVYQPRENGAGGYSVISGGGVVWIEAGSIVNDGHIFAEGGPQNNQGQRGGAGGSVWLDIAGEISGSGSVQARGSWSDSNGGGGAIAIEYGSATGTVLDNLKANSGESPSGVKGGAGSVYTFQEGVSTYGDLVVDNGGNDGAATILPSLGQGQVTTSTSDGTLVTDQASFQPYFVGHWVEVRDGADQRKGVWRIAEIAGGTLTLEPDGTPMSFDTTDTWRGMYRFDQVSVSGCGRLIIEDAHEIGTLWVDPGSSCSSARLSEEDQPLVSIDLDPVATLGTDTYYEAETVTIDVQASDASALTNLVLTGCGDPVSTTGAPISQPCTLPEVSTETTITLVAEATDEWGNVGSVTRQVTVRPYVDPDAPGIAFLCGMDGPCAPGVVMNLSFEITAQTANVGSWAVYVNDALQYEELGLDQPQVTATVPWTPPTGAQPGETFVVRVEAGTTAGATGSEQLTFQVTGTVLDPAVTQTIDSGFNGHDLVLPAGTYTVTEAVYPASLTLLEGARLVPPGAALPIEVYSTGPVTLNCGAFIDATGMGYGPGETYPGETPGSSSSYVYGGSHIGQGWSSTYDAGTTYGSVAYPQEAGAGEGAGSMAGGGIIQLSATDLVLLEGAMISADGQSGQAGTTQNGGAGGSVSITTVTLNNLGAISAAGGNGGGAAGGSTYGFGGGGGAVAVEYDDDLTSVPGLITAAGGVATENLTNPICAASGSVLEIGPSSSFGSLTVEAACEDIRGTTMLPSLGSGTAGSSSSGVVLDTGLGQVQPYFWGHWVQVESSADGQKRLWQIVSINGGLVELQPNAEFGSPVVVAGDLWQGAYRFDSLDQAAGAAVSSDDIIIIEQDLVVQGALDAAVNLPPLVVKGDLSIESPVRATSISGNNLVVGNNGLIMAQQGNDDWRTDWNPLSIDMSGTLTIRSGGSIDVTSMGYVYGGGTHPWAVAAEADAGGSHLGLGEDNGDALAGTAFGSVYAPREMGGSGGYGYDGGGVISIKAADLVIESGGSIVADSGFVPGFGTDWGDWEGGAGGSIWVALTGSISNNGVIRANGYESIFKGSGAGGAIAITYESDVNAYLGTLEAFGPSGAGAGTVYIEEPAHADGIGRLVVSDSTNLAGQPTILPRMGAGIAMAGSSGSTLVTDLSADLPEFFQYHWVELRQPDSTLRGIWRIAEVQGTAVTLAANPDWGTPQVYENDLWRAMYRFAEVEVSPGSYLVFGDWQEVGTYIGDPAAVTYGNEGPPVIDLAGVQVVYTTSGTYQLEVAAGAVTDADNPIIVEVTHSGWSGSLTTLMVSGNALTLGLDGIGPGDTVEVFFTDNHPAGGATAGVALVAPPDNAGAPAVNTSSLQLLPMGLGYQVLGDPGWASDGEWPLTVTVENTTTGWTSPALVLDETDPLYSVIVGSPGDSIAVTATDSHLQLPLSSVPAVVGSLPAAGLTAWEKDLQGHTVTALRDEWVALIDGAQAAIWVGYGNPSFPEYPGLAQSRDISTADSLGDEIIAVDGGNLISWWSYDDAQGNPQNDPMQPLVVSPGVLTHLQAYGDDLLTVAEEADGIHVYRVHTPVFGGGDPPTTLESACDPNDGVLLAGTAGLTPLALVPAPLGTVGVVVDDPTAELRMLDINDPAVMVAAGSIDLPWTFWPTWVEVDGADLLVGRDDGGVELWRWTETGPERFVEWAPATGFVTSAVRVGEHLWAGLDNGEVVQVAIRDPQAPIAVGSIQLAYPIRGIKSFRTNLLVAATSPDDTAGTFFYMGTQGLVTGLSPEGLAWGHNTTASGRVTWAYSGRLESDVAEVSVRWSDGTEATCTDIAAGCMFSTPGEQAEQPELVAVGTNGVAAAAVRPGDGTVRTFNNSMGARIWLEYQVPRPQDKCSVERVIRDFTKTATNTDTAFIAYLEHQSSTIPYVYYDIASGTSGWTQIPVQGLPVGAGSRNGYLHVLADDLEVWDTNGTRGGDPQTPVASGAVQLFGTDPVSVVDHGWGGFAAYKYLVAAQNPPRFGVIDPSQNPPVATADNVVLPNAAGNVVDLVGAWQAERGAEVLWVLTDDGTAGRLYTYNVNNLTAPVAMAEAGLAGVAPAIDIQVDTFCDGTSCRNHLVVVRQGWGIEVYDVDLQLVASVELPGDPRDVRQAVNDGISVAVGNLGVAYVLDLLGQPSVTFATSNGDQPGNALGFQPRQWRGVFTPNGLTLMDSAYVDAARAPLDKGSDMDEAFDPQHRRRWRDPR